MKRIHDARLRGDWNMKRKGSQKTHDKGLTDIIRRLKRNPNYNIIYRELEYGTKYTAGEIDVLAYHVNGNAVIFEYKSNDTPKTSAKARNQLQRARGYVRSQYRNHQEIRTVYVHGDPIKYHKIK